MQSRKKITRTQPSAKNGATKIVGHYYEDSPIARLFELLSEGKEVKIDGLSETLAKGTAGSPRNLKKDPTASGRWIVVRKNRAVRIAIRQRKKAPATARAQA